MLALICLPSSTAEAQTNTFPGEEWQTAAPDERGVNPEELDELARLLGSRGCVIKDGYIVKTWGSLTKKGDWLSAAKPVLSTLLLFAIQEGKVAGVDSRVWDYGWEFRPKDRSITFRHLASMSSGYARPESTGEAWAYNDYAIQLYQQTLFDRVYKGDPAEIANDVSRFGALGLQDGLSFRTTNRRMSASVRDFARIAWFWLNKGRWRDRQLLPRESFEEFMSPRTPRRLAHTAGKKTDDYLGIGTFGGGSDHFTHYGAGIYGGNWWFNGTGRLHPDRLTWPDAPPDTVMAIGFGGNSSAFIPSLNIALVAAGADWGRLEAGRTHSRMNQILKHLAASAGWSVSEVQPTPRTREPLVSGEQKQWHKITVSFFGPESGEEAEPNPFVDYRLHVTFTNGQRSFTAPGYYAADGNAAETGAANGNVWKVHFIPEATGEWRWKASFRAGPGIAVATEPSAGQAVAFNGAEGRFNVSSSDKTAPDFRALGVLEYVGEHYLRFSGSHEYFLKNGAGSPETLLAYGDFDQTPARHRYEPHARDFRAGDPTWRGGKGKNLIGGLNYLASKGVNSVYFLTMNVKGDGDDVWPWTSRDERIRYDVSKLDQWEIVFSHMDRLGLMLHIVTQEQENDQLLDEGELGPTRRLYYRELVARFGHHLGITWNLGEENTNTTEQRRAFATYLAALDPRRRLIALHTFPGRYDGAYNPLLGFDSLGGPSLQTNQTHEQTMRWIDRSAAAGHKWVVSLDEIGPAQIGVKPDAFDPAHDEVRQKHLWGHFMAGGAGVEWLFGYAYPHNDLDLEDWRSRDHMWDLTRYAVDFFRNHLPFPEMRHCDGLLSGDDAYCFGKPGSVYAVYLAHPVPVELNLGRLAARFDVRWYNPRRGGELHRGSVQQIEGPGRQSLGHPPGGESGGESGDWVALVRALPGELSGGSLTVENGIGGGAFPHGVIVEIAAAAPPAGMLFDRWVGDTEALGDSSAPSTTAIANGATVRARFKLAPPGPSVTGVTLVDADTGKPIPGFNPLADGAEIVLSQLAAKRLGIIADVPPERAVRVDFKFGNRRQSEGRAPFSLGGGSGRDIGPVRLSPGEHTLEVTAFGPAKVGGMPGDTLVIHFRVTR